MGIAAPGRGREEEEEAENRARCVRPARPARGAPRDTINAVTKCGTHRGGDARGACGSENWKQTESPVIKQFRRFSEDHDKEAITELTAACRGS